MVRISYCEVCGIEMRLMGRGKPARFCSAHKPLSKDMQREIHMGSLLFSDNSGDMRDLDRKALAFIMAERARVAREQEEGPEAVRIALRGVQVHSVDHAPSRAPWHSELSELIDKADAKFQALPENTKKRLRNEMKGRLKEAA